MPILVLVAFEMQEMPCLQTSWKCRTSILHYILYYFNFWIFYQIVQSINSGLSFLLALNATQFQGSY